MPNKQPLMKLFPEEELFVRHWLFEQFHYESGPGPAKRLQIEHQGLPAELSVLIAAAIPDPAEQKVAALGPPPGELPALALDGGILPCPRRPGSCGPGRPAK
jgi:hypothetical protein